MSNDEPLVMVDWPEVRGGIEAAVTSFDGLLLDAPNERWCARSTRHRGRAVRRHASCLAKLPSRCVVDKLLLSDELLFVS